MAGDFGSDSHDLDFMSRLASLALPPLSAKSFFNMGCGDGLFFGYAFFDAARKIVGIDSDAAVIEKARSNFPACQFLATDYAIYVEHLLPTQSFDIILCTVPILNLPDPGGVLRQLMRALSKGGTLVLELGTQGADASSEDGQSGLPDWSIIEKWLDPYAWKLMGAKWVADKEHPAECVIHVKNNVPYAVLLLGPPASGKSTAARKLFGHLPVIKGDVLLSQAISGAISAPALAAIAGPDSSWQRLDIICSRMFENDAWQEFAALVAASGKGKDFIFDGYIPEVFQKAFAMAIKMHGYYPLMASTIPPELSPNLLSRRAKSESRKYGLFLSSYMAMRKRRSQTKSRAHG